MDFFIQLVPDPIGFYSGHQLLIAQIGINGILATSMFIVLYSGQLSLAAPGFMAIGAYTSVLMGLYWHTPLTLNLLAGCDHARRPEVLEAAERCAGPRRSSQGLDR